jgi:pimeloyl-ACP methyl ester carboxylesterase
MSLQRTALTALAFAAILTLGCSREDASPEPSAPAASKEPPAPVEGAPRIASTIDGVHIQYRVYGSGDPAVVLVHGWSCDSNYWSAQLDELKARYTVVTVDLAGHGASGKNRADWSLANYGEDVATVVRQIPNAKVVLVGHSMGGPVALQAASRIGDRVIGVIGVDTFKTIGLPTPTQEQLDKQLEAFRADFIGETRRFVTESFFTKDADPQFVRKVAEDMALSPPEVAIPSMASIYLMDYNSVLPQIQVPIVAINADIGRPTDEKRIRKEAPTFRATVIPNTGHFLMMERPDQFNPVLLSEIESLAATTQQSGS